MSNNNNSESIVSKPTITVMGVGGAGGNAINNMLQANLQGAQLIVANTDAQALKYSNCTNKIQLGASSTKGLGAGACPEIGEKSAQESEDEIRTYLQGSNMLFIAAGMGGGTGTGSSPVIAKIAKELGILTVGVVTKPFLFEGNNRMVIAEKGVKDLQKYVDTLIVTPNQNLFRIASEKTGFADAFRMSDDVLHAGVRGITDLMIMPGLINLDFADIKTVMSEMGKAMMGTGEASGEDRAIKAAEAAITNPLIDQSSIYGARGVLINITGGKDMTLYEVDSAANRIREEIGDHESNIIFGSAFNSELEGTIRVSVVATGIDSSVDSRSDDINIKQGAANKRSKTSAADHGDGEVPVYDEYEAINFPKEEKTSLFLSTDSNKNIDNMNNKNESSVLDVVNNSLECNLSGETDNLKGVGIIKEQGDLSVVKQDLHMGDVSNRKKVSFLKKLWTSFRYKDNANHIKNNSSMLNERQNTSNISFHQRGVKKEVNNIAFQGTKYMGPNNIHETPNFLKKDHYDNKQQRKD